VYIGLAELVQVTVAEDNNGDNPISARKASMTSSSLLDLVAGADLC
jgi:hypothetical protein